MSKQPARRPSLSLFSDFADFFGPFPMLRPTFGGHIIKVEDSVSDGRYVVRAELPGLDPATDIQVNVRDGRLTIHAERTEESTETGHSEFSYGSLSRSVQLPPGAKEDDVSANYAKGILTVSVGLGSGKAQAKSIPIESKD